MQQYFKQPQVKTYGHSYLFFDTKCLENEYILKLSNFLFSAHSKDTRFNLSRQYSEQDLLLYT